MIRHAAVAGYFYPGRKAELESTLSEIIPNVPERRHQLGVMLPHAGYLYSGAIAGETLAGVELPGEAILLGPNHTGEGALIAVSTVDAWETPLGAAPLATDLARAIACIPPASADEQAHRQEHSLEVLVPLLQWLKPELKIVPVCIRCYELEELLRFAAGLAQVIRERSQPPLLVTSSDMSHFLSGELARKYDFMALEQLLALDPAGLFQTVRSQRISMCGIAPAVVMLECCRLLGATRAKLVRYGNSGDRSGDQSEVVGYAGVVVG